jgi:replicative DNA helicase
LSSSDASGRVPPSDLDAEAAVLSAILLAPAVLEEVRPILSPAAWYADANRRLYEAAIALADSGRTVDVVSVAGYLRDKGRLQQVGGTPYLAQLSDATPAVAHVEAHARRVAEKGLQRQLIASCTRFATEGYSDVGEVQTWAQNVAQAFTDLAVRGETEEPAETLSELLPGVLKSLAERSRAGTGLAGVDTGLRELNRRTGGLMRGKVHIIGARPAMGKSTVALQIAHNVAARGLGAVFASLEMTKEELALKLLASDARVDSSRLLAGKIERTEWPALLQGRAQLQQLPLSLRYCPNAPLPSIRSTVRQEQRRFSARGVQLGLVVVDYLGLIEAPRERGQSREEVVSGVMRGLVGLAAEFNVPVLVACQLNRGVESRANKSKRPALSDLRESGSIEQDAYTVTLLYREEYYDRQTRHRGVLEANVAKARGYPGGRALLRFTPEHSRVDDLAEDYDFPEDELDGFA